MDKKAVVLDIAMNLNRIGNWVADDYPGKKKRILLFLNQTTEYINSLQNKSFSPRFNPTWISFTQKYSQIEKDVEAGKKDKLELAEKLMTWGNILTHRVNLI